MILLDTNVCIRLLNRSSTAARDRLTERDPTEVRLCSIVRAELLYGARKSSRVADNMRLLERFFAPLVTLPFDDLCAEHYGMIRADLERSGQPIGPYDTMIAATARAHDLTLVTHNTGEFSRVVGLRLEDWELS